MSAQFCWSVVLSNFWLWFFLLVNGCSFSFNLVKTFMGSFSIFDTHSVMEVGDVSVGSISPILVNTTFIDLISLLCSNLFSPFRFFCLLGNLQIHWIVRRCYFFQFGLWFDIKGGIRSWTKCMNVIDSKIQNLIYCLHNLSLKVKFTSEY